jgi:hypothetical protein
MAFEMPSQRRDMLEMNAKGNAPTPVAMAVSSA